MSAPALRPCRSPYCECEQGRCSHPGCYDARHEPITKIQIPTDTMEQEFATHFRRGVKEGRAAAVTEILTLLSNLEIEGSTSYAAVCASHILKHVKL